MANRKNRRANTAIARKNNKAAKNDPQRVIPTVVAEKGKARKPTNFNTGLAAAAVKKGADLAASDAKNALGEAMTLVNACVNKQMVPKDAKEYLRRVRIETIKRRAKAWNITLAEATKQTAPVNAQRESELASVMKLHTYLPSCLAALWKTLAKFDDLSIRRIVDVSRVMRGKRGKPGWAKDKVNAPSREWLARIIKEGKKKVKGTGKPKGKGKKKVFGMPGKNKPVDGLGHALKCLVAFDKANGALLASNERKLLTASINNVKKLFTPLKAAVAARDAEIARKLAAKTEK